MKPLSTAPLPAAFCISLAGALVPLAGALVPLSAQVVLSPGDQVRVTSMDAVHTGTLVSVDGDELHLANGQPVVIALPAIERVEVMTMKTEFARSMAITVGVMALGGGTFGAATWKPCERTGWFACMFHPSSRSNAFKQGAAFGTLLGIPIGALVGLMATYERWDTALTPLHDEHASVRGRALSMSVTPLAIDRAVFQVTLPVGGVR